MTDNARITRLTELARQVWPDIEVEADCVPHRDYHPGGLGAWVQMYRTQEVGPVESGPVILSIPRHPRALDALEAALLVLAGDGNEAAMFEAGRRFERARAKESAVSVPIIPIKENAEKEVDQLMKKRILPPITKWDLRPGSAEALQAGCRCPVIDNGHGRGRGSDGEQFGWFIQGNCPIHGQQKEKIP